MAIGKRVGGGTQTQIGRVVPVLLVVAGTVLGRGRKVGDLVTLVPGIGQQLVGEKEKLRMLRLRQLIHETAIQPAAEEGVPVERQLVAAEMIDSEGHGLG